MSASGWTYDNTFLLWDYETGSLWYPLSFIGGMTSVGGTFADRKLPEIASERTTWANWKANHPNTKYWGGSP
jgi:hypothetical protein